VVRRFCRSTFKRDGGKLDDIDIRDQQVFLIDAILKHKNEYTESFLKEKGLPHTYKKSILRSKLKEGLDDNDFTELELIKLLDRIEEFGNQHIYLYNCTPEYCDTLKRPDYIQNILDDSDLGGLYNKEFGVIVPERPMLCSVIHNEKTLKFKWIEKRVWRELIDKTIEDDKYIETYQMHVSRGITTFRIDLVLGYSELMIQRLPRGTKYEDIKDTYIDKLSNFIEIGPFSKVGLGRAIKNIEASHEVEKRQINLESTAGGKVTFKSKKKGSDYNEDPHLNSARTALAQNVSGISGNFYWMPNDILRRDIHTHIYAKDDRVGIFKECDENEVNYVLSRIRHFASQ